MSDTLDIDLLRTFAVIAEMGALSRAATRIGRTQAAISLQVQRLERIVGHPLLERTGRGVHLTAQGTARPGTSNLDLEAGEPAALLRRQRYILAEGRIAPGIVTEVKNKQSQHGERHVAVFEFPLLSGGVGKGHTIPEKKNYFVGQKVNVVYLPDEPSKNAVYPMGLVKQAGIFPQERRPAKVVKRVGIRTRRALA